MGIAGFVAALGAVAAFLSAAMAGAWLVWRKTGNAGWVDTTWTFAVGTAGAGGAVVALLAGVPAARPVVVIGLATAWAFRLGLHIARRSGGVSDDPRYARLAEGWGTDAPRQMFLLLQKQAIVSIPLALAMVLAAWNRAPFGVDDVVAILILVVAVAGEGLADRQLRAFRATPGNPGRVCDVGLWSWSRHPNYFFEWLGWLAYPLFAIDLAGERDRAALAVLTEPLHLVQVGESFETGDGHGIDLPDAEIGVQGLRDGEGGVTGVACMQRDRQLVGDLDHELQLEAVRPQGARCCVVAQFEYDLGMSWPRSADRLH